MKINVLSFVLLVGCGKNVTYEVPDVVPKTPPGQVFCTLNCDELGGDRKAAPVLLEFEQRNVSHNQVICSEFRLHGSIGKTSLGCNDVPSDPVQVLSKLRNSGDCQRVSFWSETPTPGKFNVNQHPGHYEICEQTGSHIWIDVEDHAGVEDFDDATVDVRAVNGEDIEWRYEEDDKRLFICLQ